MLQDIDPRDQKSEVAMYESLSQAAELSGDTRTLELARKIQRQEKQTAEKVWAQVAPAARKAILAHPAAA
jgi:ferritin-like metal-binding protein YciE